MSGADREYQKGEPIGNYLDYCPLVYPVGINITPAPTPNIGLGGFNDSLQSVARERDSNKRQSDVEGDLLLENDIGAD